MGSLSLWVRVSSPTYLQTLPFRYFVCWQHTFPRGYVREGADVGSRRAACRLPASFVLPLSRQEFPGGERCFAGRRSEPIARDGVQGAPRAACALPTPCLPCLHPLEAEGVPFPEGEPLGGVTCRRNPRGIGGGAKSLSSSPESFRPS